MKGLTQDHDALATLEPQLYIDRDPVPKNKSSMLNRGQRIAEIVYRNFI